MAPIQFLAGQDLGREADCSPPSSAKVKDGETIQPVPQVFMAEFVIN
jgi:hypothetical protein